MVLGTGILTSGTHQLWHLFHRAKLIFRLAVSRLTHCSARHRYFDLRYSAVVASLLPGKVNISAGIAEELTHCGARQRYFDL